ncbi:MAG TPA: hypothetical protein VF762_15160 [Blastocatellia bacterium]|jgi:imidazolonepropionase-like amidohydrolase
MNSQKKMWLKTCLVLTVVFFLGCVTGASLDGIYRLRSGADRQAVMAPSIRDTDAYFDTLKRELDLNAEQEASMRMVLDRTRDEYKAVCADVRPRYDAVRARAREQMRALLTAGQQQRFDLIVTQEDCKCPEPKK